MDYFAGFIPSTIPVAAGTGLLEAQSQGLHPSVPHGWQRPKYLSRHWGAPVRNSDLGCATAPAPASENCL